MEPACPRGFRAAAGCCGLKPSGRPDLALVVADEGSTAAAIFTRNRLRAAPVQVSQAHLARSGGRARALLLNAGVANAATGLEGLRRAQRTADALAGILGCAPQEVLVNSTGVIGVPLPEERIAAALPQLVARCGPAGLRAAAEAIMTTDTVPKLAAAAAEHEDRAALVAGIAKGAGMIHPDMATMIAVLLTDARIEPQTLHGLLCAAAERSFHRISVDGDTSTNDSVFALASGRAGPVPPRRLGPAIEEVCRRLALAIVRDGEGASRLIRVRVTGARTAPDALAVARTVACSLLVRTAVAGGDPNWGRILAAAGRSGVVLDPQRIAIRANDVPLCVDGAPADVPRAEQAAAFAQQEVLIEIDLRSGSAADEYLTCDLTEEYVRINAHYTT